MTTPRLHMSTACHPVTRVCISARPGRDQANLKLGSVGQNYAPQSPYNDAGRLTYHFTQYHDAAAATSLDPESAPSTFINFLLGDYEPQPLFYDVTQPPNTALVFSGRRQEYKKISLHKSKQPVLVNPTQHTYTLEFEHPTVGRQFISTFEPSGTVLSLLSGIYEYFQEKLSAPEFAMLSQMGDVYNGAQMSMRARLGHNGSSRGSGDGVRKADFLGECVILQGVELDLDGRGRPSVLLIKFSMRPGEEDLQLGCSAGSPDVLNFGH